MRSYEAYSPNVVKEEFSEGLIALVQHSYPPSEVVDLRIYRAFWARKRPMANTATQSMVA